MRYFVTGCDKNTEWQLPWFIKNFRKHCDLPLMVADFGMTTDAYMMAEIDADKVVNAEGNGWFSKVDTMWRIKSHLGEGEYCWLDTDCQVLQDPSGIFSYIEPNKLSVAVDRPWTNNGSPWTPQGNMGPWYNTGVVAFTGQPLVLQEWYSEVKEEGKHRGDQEALYWILNLNEMHRALYVSELPHRFNVLRLDAQKGNAPNNPIIMHWTGQKGNEEIRRQISE